MTAARLKRATFRTSRLLDFCSRKELIAQTGHQPSAWPLVALKELVDNALDACEDASVAPKVQVAVDRGSITVTDNGPGIPADTVAGVLDFSVRVSNREAYVSPTRGAQGNALKTLVAMPFVLAGDGGRGRIDVSARGFRHEIGITVDRIRGEPVISHEKRPDRSVKNGTSVRVHWPDSASSILDEARPRFLQIAEDFAWVNPHVTLSVAWLNERFRFTATDPAWKKWLPSDPTCPHWYRPDHLERLISAYISHDRDRGCDRTVREFIAELRGLTATAKQKALLEATGMARLNLSELVQGNGLNGKSLETLLVAMKAHAKKVKPLALGVIGSDHLAARCESLGAEMESFEYKRTQGEKDGVPWLAEIAFVWLGDESKAKRRFIAGVNWSPGIINPFRELGTFGQSLDSLLEQQRTGREEPVVFVLHEACPRVEYTDRGKSAVVIEGADATGSKEEE